MKNFRKFIEESIDFMMQKSNNQTNEAKRLPNRHSQRQNIAIEYPSRRIKNQLWNYESTFSQKFWTLIGLKPRKKSGFKVSEMIVGSSQQDRKWKRSDFDFLWVSNPRNLVFFGLAHLQLVGSAQEKSHHFAPEALI